MSTYGNYVWSSKAGPIRVSDMTDRHLSASLEKMKPGSTWHDIFATEIREREEERKRVKAAVLPGTKKADVGVTLSLSRMPANCTECPFYEYTAHFDEDAFFGSGIVRYCPFGASYFGCHIEVPKDCPLRRGS